MTVTGWVVSRSRRPLLFIDIDGVLNRLVHHLSHAQKDYVAREVFNRRLGRTFTLFMDPADGPRLLSLTDVVDLAWGTTWEDEANESIGPWLGLPELPVAVREPGELAKAAGVMREAGDRPFAWLDDDLGHMRTDLLAEHPQPTLPIHVDPITGLTDAHIRQVRQWAENVTEKSSS